MAGVVFLTNDLLFQSRVSSMASAAKIDLFAARTVDQLIAKLPDDAQIDLILVDLTLALDDLSESLATLRKHCPKASAIAYGPHVHESKLQRASEAGFDQVMTRGQFDRHIPSLINGLATDA